MKKFIAIAVAAFLLAGCSNSTTIESTSSATSAEISSETTSSVTESSSESVSTSVEESSTKESSSSEESSSAPVETSTSSSTIIEEKPISSSSTSSYKPVEKPVSSSSNPVSSSSKPTCEHIFVTETHRLPNPECLEKITKCQICGYELSKTPTHEYENGVCIWCGKYDPNVSHNCTRDGHIWNNSYTESSTENVEIIETHILSNNGYDYDLAERYFGRGSSDTHFSDIFGAEFGSGSSKVKTTGVKTITRFIHECSECGYKEVYNTEETVTPGDNWVYAGTPRSKYFPVIWYDINNIPDEVYDGIERDIIEWQIPNGWATEKDLIRWQTEYGSKRKNNN